MKCSSSFNKKSLVPGSRVSSANVVEVCACHLGLVPTGAYLMEDAELSEEGSTPELWDHNTVHLRIMCIDASNDLKFSAPSFGFPKYLLALTVTALRHSLLLHET